MDFSDMEKMKHSPHPNTCALWLALTTLQEISINNTDADVRAHRALVQIGRYLDQHRQVFEA
jgi:hypothetical protein